MEIDNKIDIQSNPCCDLFIHIIIYMSLMIRNPKVHQGSQIKHNNLSIFSRVIEYWYALCSESHLGEFMMAIFMYEILID